MDKTIDPEKQARLSQLREALYQAYDLGNTQTVYQLSRQIDRLQSEHTRAFGPIEAGVG